jgi:hypothetical protein
LIVRDVVERDVGIFRPTPAIVLKVDGDVACLPKVPATGDAKWQVRRTTANTRADKSLRRCMEYTTSTCMASIGQFRVILR